MKSLRSSNVSIEIRKNYNFVLWYRKAGTIIRGTLHKISLVKDFLTLNKLHKIVLVNLFPNKINLLRNTGNLFGGNIWIFPCLRYMQF